MSLFSVTYLLESLLSQSFPARIQKILQVLFGQAQIVGQQAFDALPGHPKKLQNLTYFSSNQINS